MNMLVVEDFLPNQDRLRRFEQVGQTPRGVREMPVIHQLVGLALAKQDEARVLAGEGRIKSSRDRMRHGLGITTNTLSNSLPCALCTVNA